jgi:alpha-amylase/alpha-mannosidase (GH57 family)
MLYRIDDFKNLKLNFNISPTLIDSLERYAQGFHDIHSRLLISDVKDLDERDLGFILNNFFHVNYNNLILKRKYYAELYNKRYTAENVMIDDFSPQEYSDIMANFTLAWIDKKFLEIYPELKALSEKERHYTLEDRIKIYNYSLQIIKDIIPKFKEYQKKGKIEISTNPYYHPILPLLIDTHELYCPCGENIPKKHHKMEEDASLQTKRSLDKFEKLFGKRPRGVWLSEQCVSEKTIKLLNDLNVKWTVTDAGILANTINKEFSRGFDGNLEDPFDLCVTYKIKGEDTNILFSDSFVSNLVGFGYGSYEAQVAANDLYDKIKTVQDKLQKSPKKSHLLTIAMDGENCWESYPNDGDDFLNLLYGLITKDSSLETVLISDYLDKNESSAKLKGISSGSWINRNFNLWIGEPVKNLAWSYLNRARDDVKHLSKKCKDKDLVEKAMEEIYIAEGSDWFWWYGEPNDSGRDHIFDYLFRTHLKNAYQILNHIPPEEFDIPLISAVGKPIRHPKGHMTPEITGKSSETITAILENAGYIFLPDNPTFGGNKIIRGIHFCNDDDNLYLRFEVDKNSIKYSKFMPDELYIYFKNENQAQSAPIRLTSKTENVYPILKHCFTNEIKFTFDREEIFPPRFSQATSSGLWVLKLLKQVRYAYKDVIELAISFEDLGVEKGSSIEFCVISAKNAIMDEVFPQDSLLKLTNI